MKKLPFQKRTLALVAVLAPLFILFVYVALRSGPLALTGCRRVRLREPAQGA